MKKCKKILFITIALLSLTAFNSFAAITTNFIDSFSAPNGSIIIYVNVFDTTTFKSYISSLKIVDKKNKTLFDGPLNEKFSWIVHFDGKIALFINGTDQKIASYKLKGNSFDQLNKLEIPNINNAYVEGKIACIFTSSGLSSGLKAYNTILSKKMFEIPESNQQFVDIFANGVVAQSKKSVGSETITYTKKGKPLSVHDVIIPTGAVLQKEVDQYGGLLYWFLIGQSNTPITYLNKKGKKVPDSFEINDIVGTNWLSLAWSGKNLYVGDLGNSKIFAFKIGKKSAFLNSIAIEPFFSIVRLDKSKVFISNFTTPLKAFASSYDKNLKSQKWKSGFFDYTAYLGKNTFEGGVGNGNNTTVTIFKNDKKTIATHTYADK
jgi:hypothetical protein